MDSHESSFTLLNKLKGMCARDFIGHFVDMSKQDNCLSTQLLSQVFVWLASVANIEVIEHSQSDADPHINQLQKHYNQIAESPELLNTDVQQQNTQDCQLKKDLLRPVCFKMFANFLNIECFIILGHVRNMSEYPSSHSLSINHIWNIIKLSRQYFTVDILWSRYSHKYILHSINPLIYPPLESDTDVTTINMDYCLIPINQTQFSHIPIKHNSSLLPTEPMSNSSPIIHPTFAAKINYQQHQQQQEQNLFIFKYFPDYQCYQLDINLDQTSNTEEFIYSIEWLNCAAATTNNSKQLSLQMLSSLTRLEYVNGNHIVMHCRIPSDLSQQLGFTIFRKLDNTDDYHAVMKFLYQTENEVSLNEICSSLPFCGINDLTLGVNEPLANHFGIKPVNFLRGFNVMKRLSPPAFVEIVFDKDLICQDAEFKVKIWKLEYNKTNQPFKQLINGKPIVGGSSQQQDSLLDDEDNLPEEVTFTVRIPRPGEYTVEIYVNQSKLNEELNMCYRDSFILLAHYYFIFLPEQ